jgi:hypothetical protein
MSEQKPEGFIPKIKNTIRRNIAKVALNGAAVGAAAGLGGSSKQEEVRPEEVPANIRPLKEPEPEPKWPVEPNK